MYYVTYIFHLYWRSTGGAGAVCRLVARRCFVCVYFVVVPILFFYVVAAVAAAGASQSVRFVTLV